MTLALRITRAMESEMWMLLPMLRSRWKIAVPSGTDSGARVEKVITLSGTQIRPTPRP